MRFGLDEKELQVCNEWIHQQLIKSNAYTGASGGRFSFMFTPTTLGTITTVIDNLLQEQKVVTDTSEF